MPLVPQRGVPRRLSKCRLVELAQGRAWILFAWGVCLFSCNLTDHGGDGAGWGGDTGGSGGFGGLPECGNDAPFHVGMCLRAAYPLAWELPPEPLEEHLVVQGPAPADEPSCFGQEDEYIANPFGHYSQPSDPQRFELRDGEDRRWLLEMALPGMKHSALSANEAVALRWRAGELGYSPAGFIVVEREGVLIAGAALQILPVDLFVEPLEAECVDADGCDDPVFHRAMRVTLESASAKVSRYTIGTVGHFMVASEGYSSYPCSETQGPEAVLGFYRDELAE